jgi:UDP-N-acetylmuramoylalanine--D-glutamate ligase
LEHIHHFRPHVAVLLNLSEDHLDRYPDMGAYRRVKSRLVECQTASDRVIRNMDDEWSRETPSWGRSYPFGRPSDEEGAWVEGGAIWICREGKREVVMDCQQLPLPGRANLENALAAVSVGSILGLSTPLPGDWLNSREWNIDWSA